MVLARLARNHQDSSSPSLGLPAASHRGNTGRSSPSMLGQRAQLAIIQLFPREDPEHSESRR